MRAATRSTALKAVRTKPRSNGGIRGRTSNPPTKLPAPSPHVTVTNGKAVMYPLLGEDREQTGFIERHRSAAVWCLSPERTSGLDGQAS